MAIQLFELNDALLDALGIKGDDVSAVDIKLRPDHPPVIEVTHLLTEVDEAGELVKVLERCELVEVTETVEVETPDEGG